MATTDTLPDGSAWRLPDGYMLPPCPFHIEGAHDFDAHVVDGFVIQQNCRRCGLVLPLEKDPDGAG